MGGLVYRRDILETMTGGNVAFPSGSEEPTTIADWEYMLELMKQYFTAAGLPDYACLILPATGYFSTGELISGFGIGGTDYLKEDGSVGYGIAEDNFYNYLVKMKEWYAKGYIYADFAGRSQDLFYLPNTALTYGGSAGIWFGPGAAGGRCYVPAGIRPADGRDAAGRPIAYRAGYRKLPPLSIWLRPVPPATPAGVPPLQQESCPAS